MLEGGKSIEEGLDDYFEWKDTTCKEKINQAGNDIDQPVGTRKRIMQIKLKEVEELAMSDSTVILNAYVGEDE